MIVAIKELSYKIFWRYKDDNVTCRLCRKDITSEAEYSELSATTTAYRHGVAKKPKYISKRQWARMIAVSKGSDINANMLKLFAAVDKLAARRKMLALALRAAEVPKEHRCAIWTRYFRITRDGARLIAKTRKDLETFGQTVNRIMKSKPKPIKKKSEVLK